jgi:hypothetical protein
MMPFEDHDNPTERSMPLLYGNYRLLLVITVDNKLISTYGVPNIHLLLPITHCYPLAGQGNLLSKVINLLRGR